MKPKIKPMTPGVPQAARTRAYAAGLVVKYGYTCVSRTALGPTLKLAPIA